MATPPGREMGDLSERLFQTPFRFDFFQAVRLLERLAHFIKGGGEQGALNSTPQAFGGLVGQDNLPEQEAVRFRSQPSLSFPASAIVQMRPLRGGDKIDAPAANADSPAKPETLVEMVVSFLGITGPSGVLPHHYTAMLLRRIRAKDFSLRDFLDLFHHRAISLFYRSWVKYRLPFAYERSRLDPQTQQDLITWGIYCVAGMGTRGLRGRLDVDDVAFLYYSGHFAHLQRSASVLESLLTDYFDMPIRVLQLQGQWLLLGDDQTVMPGPAHPGGLNNQLGVNLVVGERVWNVQSKFRIQLGPLTYAQFKRFMPSGDALRPLCQLTRSFVGPEFDFDVQLLLRAEEVPQSQVGPQETCLGWNSWSRTQDFTHVAEDAVFSLDQI
jgi:type VI secretion system protein ImpH